MRWFQISMTVKAYVSSKPRHACVAERRGREAVYANMSESVRAGLAEYYRQRTLSDVSIRFCNERSPDEQCLRGSDSTSAIPEVRFFGDPVSAHKLALSLGSDYFATKLQREDWNGSLGKAPNARADGTEHGQGNGSRSKKRKAAVLDEDAEAADDVVGAGTELPVLLVPLGSEDEVPYAREAIEFIYTGSVSAALDFEALLRVRQQACYLGVKLCPQACDAAVVAWLQAEQQQPQQQPQQQSQQQRHDSSGASQHAAARPRVLAAYSCHALFPDAGAPRPEPETASFDAVRSILAKQLVSHFGDALAALTRPELYQQLLQLPAVAVKELLAADDFGTDSEDSVFLLLACWLEAHKDDEGGVEPTRRELCGLVRMHRLSSTYMHFVLPACPLYDVGAVELGFLLRYVGAEEEERKELLALADQQSRPAWYCSKPRRQVVPEGGRTLEWSISRKDLEGGLRRMLDSRKKAWAGARCRAPAACFDADSKCRGSAAVTSGWGMMVYVSLDPEVLSPEGGKPGAAGVWIHQRVPTQLGPVKGVARLRARLMVHRWRGGQREEIFTGVADACMDINLGYGWATALAVQPAAGDAAAAAAAAAAGGSGAGGAAAGGDRQECAAQVDAGREAELRVQLERWSEWMHEGEITGTVTLPGPS